MLSIGATSDYCDVVEVEELKQGTGSEQQEIVLCVNRLISALPCILCSQHQDTAVISQFVCWLYVAVKHCVCGRLFAILCCAAI